MKNSEDEKDVEIFHRVNKLKLKAGGSLHDAGPGRLDPEAIKRADSVVMKMASLYPREIKNVLTALSKEWEAVRATEKDEDRKKFVKKISNTANQIKDLGSTFGYNLMAYFGESLRDYILETDLSKKEHIIIVQAHIDVMAAAYRENLKDDDGGPMAVELKKMVHMAIEKYSTQKIQPVRQQSEQDSE